MAPMIQDYYLVSRGQVEQLNRHFSR